MKYVIAMLCGVSVVYGAEPSFELAQQPIELQVPVLKPTKSPALAVGLSSLFPGLGHAYLEDGRTAGALAISTGLGIGLTTMQKNLSDQIAFSTTVQAVWSYGLYAAYRDARNYNGQSGYSYKMPTDSFTDLTFAPFKWSVLKKPEVWGGFIGMFAAAVGVSALYPKEARIALKASPTSLSPLIALPVGVGEESLFRGFLQSALSEYLTPWGGIAVSSLAFGAAHLGNAAALEPDQRWRYYAVSIPFITGMGVYLGWITQRNHSLKESVALHTWYDFVIFAASAAATQAAITGRTDFALSIPF